MKRLLWIVAAITTGHEAWRFLHSEWAPLAGFFAICAIAMLYQSAAKYPWQRGY